jgi:hypothetical protein
MDPRFRGDDKGGSGGSLLSTALSVRLGRFARLRTLRLCATSANAIEVAEEFAKHVEMIAAGFGFAADAAQNGM